MNADTNTAARADAAPAARLARCATCGERFTPRNNAHLHCSPECRRLSAKINAASDQADEILAAVASTTRARAIFRLRAALVAAVTADADLPGASVKNDRDQTTGAERPRRWCACCGTDLNYKPGKGRPPVSCKADTGRSCANFRNRKAQEIATLADAVAAAATNPDRARRAILVIVSERNAEIGK
jgi:hypothetical protein